MKTLDNTNTRANRRAVGLRKQNAERVAKHRKKKRIKKQIAELENILATIPAPKKYRTPMYRQLAVLWAKLHPEAPASLEKPQASKISSADVVTRGVNFANIKDDGGEHLTAGAIESGDGITGGFSYGMLNGSPVDQGPRFNCPEWLLDDRAFECFKTRLIVERTEKHPMTRVEKRADGSKGFALDREERLLIRDGVNQDCRLLKNYFVERYDFEEPQVYGNLPKSISAIKKRGPRPAQRYITKLVATGYRILGLTEPSAEVRKARRDARQSYKDEISARAKYGKGKDPRSFEREENCKKFKVTYDGDRILRRELSILAAEDEARRRLLRTVEAEAVPRKKVFAPASLDAGAKRLALKVSGGNPRIPYELFRLGLLGQLLKTVQSPGQFAGRL